MDTLSQQHRTFRLSLLFIFLAQFSFAQSPLSQGEHFAVLNSIRVHYFVSGKGPVCLVTTPGWGIPVSYIMPLKSFEKHFTVVYFETRATGMTTGPDDLKMYGAGEFMDDMDSLRAYLKQSKVWIAGHSDGGHLVLNYAIHHQNRLNGLIVMAGDADFDSLRSANYQQLVLKRKNQPFFALHPGYYNKGAAVMLGTDTAKYTDKQIFDLTAAFYTHDGSKGIAIFKDIKFCDKAERGTTLSKLTAENLLPELHIITVPTLIIAGDDDVVCDAVSQSDRIHKNIPSSQEYIIQNCGHMLWNEQPRQFNTICEKWFRQQHL